MAGKPLTQATRRLARVVDHLSKNTLADILVDRIRAEIGENATDEQVLTHLQPWLETIARLRSDKPVNLLGILAKLDASDEAYRKRAYGDLQSSGGIIDAP